MANPISRYDIYTVYAYIQTGRNFSKSRLFNDMLSDTKFTFLNHTDTNILYVTISRMRLISIE